VLWLDFQGQDVGFALAEEQLVPLYSETTDGEVHSGALWYALYARKGDEMIESDGFTHWLPTMLHAGRFFQTMKSHGGPTLVSAVIYSLPRATVLMENPAPSRQLPENFRASLLRTPYFRLDRSICEWEPGLVSARIELERKTVTAVARALGARTPPRKTE
jgi:hypothetical protein